MVTLFPQELREARNASGCLVFTSLFVGLGNLRSSTNFALKTVLDYSHESYRDMRRFVVMKSTKSLLCRENSCIKSTGKLCRKTLITVISYPAILVNDSSPDIACDDGMNAYEQLDMSLQGIWLNVAIQSIN